MDDNTDHNLGGVFISTSQVYNTLLEVKYDVRGMASKLDSSQEKVTDHESRIRGLEKWKYAISVSVVGSLSALAITVIKVINP
ncbi:hypothetical protein GCM10022252_19730 [Streptosporangium oxazolinicum]|uniref:Uncharacterized protein n=1 Tax=Streptosporangium oxazolinicum TaxID=909287 RepID=A0ABP8ANN1_9ACTN